MALGLGILMSVFSSGTSGIESLLFPQMVEDTYEMMERSGIGTNGLVIFATVCTAVRRRAGQHHRAHRQKAVSAG